MPPVVVHSFPAHPRLAPFLFSFFFITSFRLLSPKGISSSCGWTKAAPPSLCGQGQTLPLSLLRANLKGFALLFCQKGIHAECLAKKGSM